MAPMVSPERCIGHLDIHQVKADGLELNVGRRAHSPSPLGSFGTSFFSSAFASSCSAGCGATSSAQLTEALISTISTRARPCRLDPEQPGRFAAHYAAPRTWYS